MTSKAKELSAEALEEELIGIRRHLHRHPELSNEEYGTTEYIISLLERAGVRIVEYGLSTGVIAEIGGKKPGSVIALRADIDALPIQEESGVSFASLYPGKMHACGHDFHTVAFDWCRLSIETARAAITGNGAPVIPTSRGEGAGCTTNHC